MIITCEIILRKPAKDGHANVLLHLSQNTCDLAVYFQQDSQNSRTYVGEMNV